jgi:hypothetical protein
VADATDCDDLRAVAYPGAPETCDGTDEDCDGATDEAEATDARVWYADTDGDGYGNASVATAACARPSGFVADASDCDDGARAVSPGAAEACNGLDDDCDGTTDEASASDASSWYADGDGDGHGDASRPARACARPSGFVALSDDCDDSAATVSPSASERCNGVDDDCDGATDEASAVDASSWYLDSDGDGYGGSSGAVACSAPSGHVAGSTDCDDSAPAVSPGATETCNGLDDDCDGASDEFGATGATTWYLDADGDGFGVASSTTARCSRPTGYAAVAGDCADGRSSAYPGAPETCNGLDDDCDGVADEGYGAYCESLACTGSGLIHTISDGCMDDGGGSSGGDSLQVYCVNGIARFCLSGEACAWRSSPSFDDGTTCERSGLGSDYMASAGCELWNGYTRYACTASEGVYFR